ncbi:MAG: 2OG-Fe(II) oxygenase [Alphaproteobacteria bacterium]
MVINRATKPSATAARDSGSQHFLGCLEKATHINAPYDYWLLENVLPVGMINAIANLPFPPPRNPLFNGRRESNNSTRIYFSPENQHAFDVCRDTVDIFSNAAVIRALENMTGTDISKGHLRIEYCQDVDGFWLEPHLDISVKLFTMLVYLSDDPNLFDAGTDIYDATPSHKLVASAPYEKNKGLIFIPDATTWHGFTKRPIKGLRKSIIINYVLPDWVNKDELAYR